MGTEKALKTSRTLTLPADADPVDRMALLRLRALDVQTTEEPTKLPGRVAEIALEPYGGSPDVVVVDVVTERQLHETSPRRQNS